MNICYAINVSHQSSVFPGLGDRHRYSYVSEDAKKGNPEDEQHKVPDPHGGKPQNEGNHVEDGGGRRDASDKLGVYPFAVLIFACLGGTAQVDSIETAHRYREREL
jgi:hypothetical protein